MLRERSTTLRTYRAGLIGLPFDPPQTHYVTQIHSGSMSTWREANFRVVMHACDSRTAGVVDEVRRLVERLGLDGVMLPPPLCDMPSLIEMLDGMSTPLIRIAPASELDPDRSIFLNERAAAAAMTKHLAAMGHRRIAFMTAPAATLQCYMGYWDGLRDSALPFDRAQVVKCDGCASTAIEAARELLNVSTRYRPTAIFAATDQLAAGALRAAHELKISVPQHLSIAGFGNDPIGTQVWPQISTTQLPLTCLAESAAQLLLAQLHSRPVPCGALFEPTLLMRSSTAAPFKRRPRAHRA